MAYELIVTQDATDDLDNILHYIVEDLSNPDAAHKLLEQVEHCYQQLCDFPLLYESCRNLRLRSKGYRKIPIGNFLLIYRPDEKTHQIHILRFFYGRRDYEKLL